MKRTQTYLSLLVLILTLPSCKEKVIDSSTSPGRPIATPAPVVGTTTETSPTVANQEALRLLGPIDDPDASPRGRRRPAAPTGPVDAMSNAQKAALALAASEKAVSAAISARARALQQCYESTTTTGAKVNVRIRVHRQGYVLDTTITGCNDRARACMAGVLQQMRISGMQTDSITAERTFNFRERKVIKYTR